MRLNVINKDSIITFSPHLFSDDPLASFWLKQVTMRLRRELCWCWYERGQLSESSYGTLPPFTTSIITNVSMSRHWDEKQEFFMTDPTARYLSDMLNETRPRTLGKSPTGSFTWLVDELKLDDTSSFILALALIIVFDNAAGSIISACLNNPQQSFPNLTLAQKLWDDPEKVMALAHPGHPLFRLGLIQYLADSPSRRSAVDWEGQIAVPSLVARQLLFPEWELPDVFHHLKAEPEEIISRKKAELLASRFIHKKSQGMHVIPLRGREGSPYKKVIAQLSKLSPFPIVELNCSPTFLEDRQYFRSIATFCWLRGHDLFIDTDLFCSSGKHAESLKQFFLEAQPIPINVFIKESGKAPSLSLPKNILLPPIDIPALSYTERVFYWSKFLGAQSKGLQAAIKECSRRFRYELETIKGICEVLREIPGKISEDDLIEACRAALEVEIGGLAQKITPRFDDEELILPRSHDLQFREIIKAMRSLTEVHYRWGTAKAWNESGISVLFSGPSGTGKTMAAEILAIKLMLPIYRIDLSQVVNKYIGETEKNLQKLFDAADVSDLILFFDEADALFGRRTDVRDSHDRYANLEISYLLERMERFKGLAILATNRRKNLDTAFLRRLRYVVDFPLPSAEERERIWRQAVPGKVESSGLNFEFLARQFSLTGGNIRSVIFNACLQSTSGSRSSGHRQGHLLTMEKIIIAIKREYEKAGRSISLEDFGPYASIVEDMER